MLMQPCNKERRRQNEYNRRPFICGVTALAKSQANEIALDAGMDVLIVKPLYKWQLKEVLKISGFQL